MKTMKYGKGYACGIIDNLHFVVKIGRLKAKDRKDYDLIPEYADRCSILKVITLPDKYSQQLLDEYRVSSVYNVDKFLILIAFNYDSDNTYTDIVYLVYRLENDDGIIKANHYYDIHAFHSRHRYYQLSYAVENLLQTPTKPDLFGLAIAIYDYSDTQLNIILWNLNTGDYVSKLTIPTGDKRIEHVKLVNEKTLAIIYRDFKVNKTFCQFYDVETGLLYYNKEI
jgi:hypothetical protein